MVLRWSQHVTIPDSFNYVVPKFTIYRKFKIKQTKQLTMAVVSTVRSTDSAPSFYKITIGGAHDISYF
jgi:hypothetical protein